MKILKSKADLILSIREDIDTCCKALHDALLEENLPSHLVTNLEAQLATLRSMEGRVQIWCVDFGSPDPALHDGLTSGECQSMRDGLKLRAIKEIRDRTRCGLAEAKCLVETWADRNLPKKVALGEDPS